MFGGGEFLDTVVTRIGHVDVGPKIHGDAVRMVELAVACA